MSKTHVNRERFPAPPCFCRRHFLQALGMTTTGLTLIPSPVWAAAAPAAKPRPKARVRGAFFYPPSESLRKEGYWSWPGAGFDAEGRHQAYATHLRGLGQKLELELALDDQAIDSAEGAARFIEQINQAKPDGLVLIPFKKSHWSHVVRIVEQTQAPTIVVATLGILLVDQINQLHRRPGVYLVNSLEDLQGAEWGLKMIQTAHWLKTSRLLNITGAVEKRATVAPFHTEVRTIPHARFVEEFRRTEINQAVKALAQRYRRGAKKIVEPTPADILEAAKTYFVFKQLLRDEQAEAVMMECLSGLRLPHQHVPPCMGFMSLRDEGIAAGCQSDLNATLTLMLVSRLFERPGFQQNASMNTEKNVYFGAHCTAPTRMRGFHSPPEPYLLRSHAEAGWGCVPSVLFSKGQEVTLALCLSGQKPQMIVYSGKIVGCPPNPPAGGCRTNLEMTINEVSDVCDTKGMHQVVFYGNYARLLRAFCQLYAIEVLA